MSDFSIDFFHYPVRWEQADIGIRTGSLDNRRRVWRGVVAEAFYKLSPITELGVILLIIDFSGDTPTNNARQDIIHYINRCYIMYCYYFENNFFPLGDICIMRHHMFATVNTPRILIVRKTGNTVGQLARFRTKYFLMHKKCVGVLARTLYNYLKALGLNQYEIDNPGCVGVRNCETPDCRHFIVLWDCAFGVIV